MKNLLIISLLAIVTSGCVATSNGPVTSVYKSNIYQGTGLNAYKSSCGGSYSNPSRNNFIFYVKHGDPGGCPDDNKPHPTEPWPWSERSEVKSKNLKYGEYVWTGTVTIDRQPNCEPAYRNTIFQVHGGHNTKQRPGGPPSFLGVNQYNNFRTVNGTVHYGKTYWGLRGDKPVPEVINLRVELDFKPTYIKTTYWVNDEFIIEEIDNDKLSHVFIKFGSYRVLSHCGITQSYTNVNFVKVK